MKDGNSAPMNDSPQQDTPQQITLGDIIDLPKLPDDEQQRQIDAILSELEQTDEWKKAIETLGTEAASNKDFIVACLTMFQKLAAMPEDQARALLRPLWDKYFAEIEISDDERDEVISQWYKRPESLTMPLTRVARTVFENTPALIELQPVRVTPRNAKKEIAVPVQVYVGIANEDDKFHTTLALSRYDREVFNGVCSIWATGQQTFTAKQVYEAFTGRPSTHATGQAIGAVTKSLRRLMMSLITIDWTDHARLNGLRLEEGATIEKEVNMLQMERVILRSNGQEIDGYKLLKAPALYTYAKAVGQISTTSKQFVNIPTISNTEENIIVKNYLIRRIERMKNPHSRYPRTIDFATLYKDCGIDTTTSRTALSRRRKDILAMLDYWKPIVGDDGIIYREGYIKDYEITMKGKAYHSIKIIL